MEIRKQNENSYDTNEKDEERIMRRREEHSCDYCGIGGPEEVVECEECKRWFCNNKIQNNMGSHIIVHLVMTRHREIRLHPDSSHGHSQLECYLCSTKNIFQLGFIQVLQTDDKGDQDRNVIIICRNACLAKEEYQDLKWSQSDYNAIVEEKVIANWIVQPSSAQVLQSGYHVSTQIITQYEELIQKGQQVDIESLQEEKKGKKLADVKLWYRDGQEYLDTFLPLIRAEKDQDQRMKEQLAQNNVSVRWENKKKKYLLWLVFAQKEDYPSTLVGGNKMKISNRSLPNWEAKGTIVNGALSPDDEICLEIHGNPKEASKISDGFRVELLSKPTSYLRMEQGVKRFFKDEYSISSHLYYKLLGHQGQPSQVFQIPAVKSMSAPSLPQLNVYQIEAVMTALGSALCVIQGPPGTGKTVTSATIVYQLVKQNNKKEKRAQVLVCAPSNIVVDQLASKIHATGVKVVRLCSRTRETMSSDVEFLTLHNQVRQLDIDQYCELQRLLAMQEEGGYEFSKEEEKRMKDLVEQASKEVLSGAEVICSTCITAADQRLSGMVFQQVLIDEATQAIESECLLPLLHGAKQVVLVGDHRQLGPVVNCKETARAGLNRSLFERLVSLGIRPIRLQVQYRMHPMLSVFPSNTFYEGTLQNGVTTTDRSVAYPVFNWPNPSKPMFFYNLVGVEEISSSGTSYLNRTEAGQIEKVVATFLKNNVRASQIGIITPYKGQMGYISHLLENSAVVERGQAREIEVVSVDGFQGREKDYIFISCVRSNDGLGIGFLTDPRRLNVTLTRAKYGLIICGNAKVLSRDNLWNNLLNHFNDNSLLVEGSLTNLKQTSLKFRQSQKYIPDRKNLVQYDEDNMSTNSYLRNQYQTEKQSQVMNKFSMGYRQSEFGYNQLPDLDPYKNVQGHLGTADIQFIDPLAGQNNKEDNIVIDDTFQGIGQFYIDDTNNI